MLKHSVFVISLFFISLTCFSQGKTTDDLPLIEANFCDPDPFSEEREATWENWLFPFGFTASSSLAPQGKNNYEIRNLHDKNGATAWVEGAEGYGIGQYLEAEAKEDAGKTYGFFGLVFLQNGYCKSPQSWKANSRVKTLEVQINGEALCHVRLLDTDRFQMFNIMNLLQEEHKSADENPDAKLIKPGDKIRFVIREVYKGDRYKDTAFSTFVYHGLGN